MFKGKLSVKMAADRTPKIPKSKRKQMRSSLSFTNLVRLNESLQRDHSEGDLASIAMSQMSIPSNLNDPDKHFITRGMI